MVAPQVSGFIQEVLAEDNQSVAAGQLLARIDDREYVAALAAARADLAVASAQLVNASATLERHQAVISQALAVTRADAADLRFAESEVQRHRNLASEGAGTRQAYEQARSRLDMTQARQAEHQATLQATRKQQDVLAAQHEAAQAGVLRAQALVDRAELNLSHTRVISPVDGVVGRRALRVGAYVAPGTPILPWCRCSRPTWWRTSAKTTDPHATRPARDRHRGCLSRPAAARHRAEHRARHRPEPVAGRAEQRHGQLHQDRAAPAGQDRARRHAGRRAAARAGMSVEAVVETMPLSRRPRNEPVENTAPGPDLGAVEPGRLRRGTGLPGASSAAAHAMARCRRGRPGQRAGGPAGQRRLVGQLRRP